MSNRGYKASHIRLDDGRLLHVDQAQEILRLIATEERTELPQELLDQLNDEDFRKRIARALRARNKLHDVNREAECDLVASVRAQLKEQGLTATSTLDEKMSGFGTSVDQADLVRERGIEINNDNISGEVLNMMTRELNLSEDAHLPWPLGIVGRILCHTPQEVIRSYKTQGFEKKQAEELRFALLEYGVDWFAITNEQRKAIRKSIDFWG